MDGRVLRAGFRDLSTFVCLLALPVAGCGNATTDRASLEVHDSAGVRIVSTAVPELDAWSIDSIPFIDIGTVEGTEGQDLAGAYSSRRLKDGRVVISNWQTRELRFFDPDGNYIRSAGGSGEGPGEFSYISAIHFGRADTLVVADDGSPRLSLFTPDGDFARTVRLEPIEGRLPHLRGIRQGTLALYSITFYERTDRSAAVRDTFLIATAPLEGGTATSIGRFPAGEHFNQHLPNGSVLGWGLPFGRACYTALAGGLLWIGVSDDFELRGFDPVDGALRRIIRVRHDEVPVGSDDRDRYFEHEIAGTDDADMRRLFRDAQQITTYPPTMPAYAALTSDAESNLWVRDYNVPWADTTQVWRVFGPDGTGRARVRVPAGLTIQDIGTDWVLGLWHDAMDVEHIRAYRLHKG